MKSFKMIAAIIGVLALFFSLSSCSAEEIWNTYGGAAKIVSIAAEKDFLWCASENGVFRFDKQKEKFTKFTAADGLASNDVTCVAIDRDGVKWFATRGGISSYDGKAWKKHTNNCAWVVAIDPDNVKWFGTDQGLLSYDDREWKTHLKNGFTSLMIDCEGIKWVAEKHNNGKMFEYDGKELKLHDIFSLGHGTGWAMAEDKNHVKWFSTDGGSIELFYDASDDGGIFSYDGKDWKKYRAPYWIIDHGPRKIADKFVPGIDGIVSDYFNAIAVDQDNVKWFASDCGVSSYDDKEWKILATVGGCGGYFSVTVDSDNVKWFGSASGIARYDGKNWKCFSFADGPRQHVRAIAVDRDNVKWFSTLEGEIYSFDCNFWEERYVNTYSSDDPYPVYESRIESMAVDRENVKWFGTPHGTISYDGKNWEKHSVNDPALDEIYFITVDQNNVKWFGSKGGVYNFDGVKWNFGITKVPVNCAVADKNNVIWFGIKNGVMSFDGKSWEKYALIAESDLTDYYVTTIAVDDDNNKWIGTLGDGVYCFDGKTWQKFPVLGTFSHKTVYDIAIDQENIKWFSMGDGVARYDGKAWKNYRTSDIILTAAVGLDNEKWFGTLGSVIYSLREAKPLRVEKQKTIPQSILIRGNFPNPFNPETSIRFETESSIPVSLVIYNVSGQKLKALFENKTLIAGAHSIIWNGTDDAGKAVSSGIYFYRIQAGDLTKTGKMMLIR